MKLDLFKKFRHEVETAPDYTSPIWYDSAKWLKLTETQLDMICQIIQWKDCVEKRVIPSGVLFITPGGVKIVSQNSDCYAWKSSQRTLTNRLC